MVRATLFFFSVLAPSAISCQGAQAHYGSHDTETTGDASTDQDASTDVDTDADTDTETETVDTDFPSTAIPATCVEAAENPTSVGCEFFMVDLDNHNETADASPYAVVVSNPQLEQSAHITLWDGGANEIYTATIEPGQLDVVDVACDSGCLVPPHEVQNQGLSRSAGFRLTSDVPVLAYQWNPYGVEIVNTDASLLIPVASLGNAYIGAAWGYGSEDYTGQYRSQLTLVATEDGTQVSFIPSTDLPELGDAGPFAAKEETDDVALDAADVLALSPSLWNADLTGTVIRSNHPIAVFGGHSCALVPTSDYLACDHIEEQLIPLTAWGNNAVLARYAPRENCLYEDLAVWRVIAGADDMYVRFDPPAPLPAGSEYYFEKQGDVLEFMAPSDYYAEGVFSNPEDPAHPEAPFFAYQMMTSAEYPSCPVDGPDSGKEGDPMMLLAAPAGQYLDRYVFNTDNVFDFDYDYIIVVRSVGTQVVLDCVGLIPDSEFIGVGFSDWEVARIFIDNMAGTTGCADGLHLLSASAPVGLSVVGTARATSYGYLGGIGVESINPVVVE
jgi:hypothetical protein